MSSRGEQLQAYGKAASAVGVELRELTRAAFGEALIALVRELGAGAVALPARGWPGTWFEAAEQALRAAGCVLVLPAEGPSGFTWDRERLAGAGLGVTWCPAFLADTGSLAFPSGPGFGTLASLLPPVHLALSIADCVRPDLATYLAELGELPSRLTLITGPSRTGDIEGTLTPGVHGPGRVLHWLLENA